MPKYRKPTRAEKAKAIDLAREGLSQQQILEQLNTPDATPIDGRSIGGVISSATKRGVLEGHPPQQPLPEKPMHESQPTVSALPAATPVAPPVQPAPQPHHAHHQHPSVADGFVGWRPSSNQTGAFSNASQTARYTVRRDTPPDGVIGQHPAPFDEIMLGTQYGQGTYKLFRYSPGNPRPEELDIMIGASFGPPRFPKATAQVAPRTDRPGYQRPWERPEEDGGGEPRYRPGYAPGMRDERERDRERERSAFEYGRQSAQPQGDSATAEAIRTIGEITKATVQQVDGLRKAGPDSVMSEMFKQQQERWEKQRDEEIRRDSERRKEESDKWDRRQQDDRQRHDRDMERLKTEGENRARELTAASQDHEKREAADRKFLMELEDKKLNLIREEAKMRQEQLEAELRRSREEMKAIQEKTTAEIKAVQEKTTAEIRAMQERAAAEIKVTRETTQKELTENREAVREEIARQEQVLEREHRLKEKALDKEHELNNQILEIKKEVISKEGGDQLFNMLQTVVKEFSKGLERIVDLKKIEAMSPEAQAAAVSRGSIDGNVVMEPKRGVESVPSSEAQRDAMGGGGAQLEAAEQATEEKMDVIVQDALKDPQLKSIVQEWALHVENGSDATTFANFFMELMRDEGDSKTRKACSGFANYMSPRNWDLMLRSLTPYLDAETVRVFQLPNAGSFYEQFRAIVTEQIKEWFEQFLVARQQKAQQAAVSKGQSAPSADGASAANGQGEGSRVPTRESLLPQ